MAYGVNKPNGFVPKGYTLGSLPSSGLASQRDFTFNIKNGYGNSFGLGDPVFWLPLANPSNGEGYIIAGPDAPNATNASGVCSIVNDVMVGVFAGCQYNTNTEVFGDAPMKLSWAAGTQTSDGSDPIAFVIPATFQAGFSIQTGAEGCERAGLLQMGTIKIPFGAGNVVQLRGESSQAYLSMGESGVGLPYDTDDTGEEPTPATTIQVIGFDNTLSSNSLNSSQIGLAYGNVIVRIANSPFPTFSTSTGF